MANIYNLTDTWNAIGTAWTAIKMNVTNTASAAGSKLIDLQISSTSYFAVDKDGNLTLLGTADGRDLATDGSKLDGIEALADVTDAANVDAAGAVMEADYNANTILAATADNTPTARTVAEETLVGRITGGEITALTATQARTLLNVEDGATADMTANEILSALLTVDGTGSGLDADLLDGNSSLAFATSSHSHEGTAILSTGEVGGTKFLREDGDGTSSWQTVPASGGDLKADGTVPLTADWDAGSFEIRAQTLESDVTTGTAPLTIASTTLVANLNADLLDGNEASAFATSGHNHDADYISIVTTPTTGNFPQLTAGGELVNSTYDETSFATAAQGSTADTALQDVVDDLTPQLGGSLDVNGQKIVSVSNGNIDIEPHGTGNILLGNFTIDADATVGAGQDNYVWTYDHASGTMGLEAAAASGGDFKADGSVDMTGQFRTDVGTFDSDVADGASANAYTFDTQNTYSTAGANLLRLSNNATPIFDFSYQGGIDHVNSGASTAAHSQSINLNWQGNTATTSSGQYSVVMGQYNTASSPNSYALGNANNTSGVGSAAIGQNNSVSGSGSFAFGEWATVSGYYSAAFGYGATVANRTTIAMGAHSTAGMQTMWASLHGSTTDATQTTMQAFTTNYVIPADTTWTFNGLVAARSDEADGNVSAGWKIEGVLYRDESNNTVIQGVTVTNIYTGFSTAAVAVEADDTNEALAIKVTGEAATNIRWVAKVDIAQVTYA